MVIPSSTYWNICFGVNKGDIKQDNKAKLFVIEFKKNLAWVMENLQGEC